MEEEAQPIFQRVAHHIADGILSGDYAEGASVPSSNELAAFYRINPATAGRGLAALAEGGVLYKRRGLGMYVAEGARERLLTRRRTRFPHAYLEPLVAEARALGISEDDLCAQVARTFARASATTRIDSEGASS